MKTPTHTVYVSLAQARKLPNMLGRIVPAMLQFHREYTCLVHGTRYRYVLRQTAAQRALRRHED